MSNPAIEEIDPSVEAMGYQDSVKDQHAEQAKAAAGIQSTDTVIVPPRTVDPVRSEAAKRAAATRAQRRAQVGDADSLALEQTIETLQAQLLDVQSRAQAFQRRLQRIYKVTAISIATLVIFGAGVAVGVWL